MLFTSRMTGMGAKSAPPIGAKRPVPGKPDRRSWGTEMGRHELFPPLSTERLVGVDERSHLAGGEGGGVRERVIPNGGSSDASVTAAKA